MKKTSLIKSKKHVIYAKKDLVLMMIIKVSQSERSLLLQENIEKLPIVFVIKTPKQIHVYFIMVLHMIIIL